MTKLERRLCGAIGLLAVAGLVTTIQLSNWLTSLQNSRDQLQQTVRTLLAQSDAIKTDVAKQIAQFDQRGAERTGRVEEALRAMGRAPDPADIAKIVMQQHGTELVQSVSKILVADPAATAALRGRDADPALVAKDMVQGDLLPAIVKGVQERLWEARRHDILMDPELIATIADKVYSTYGDELSSTAGGDTLAKLIAHELASEPTFAALVADLKTR